MGLWFKDQLRRVFQRDRALLVRQRFRKRQLPLLPVPVLLHGLPLFLHLHAAVVPHSDREAASIHGEAAAGAAEVPRVRLQDRRDTHRPRVVAVVDTHTDAKQFSPCHFSEFFNVALAFKPAS